MKTTPYECYDNVNVGPDNPQIQNCESAQAAAESFAFQFYQDRWISGTKELVVFVVDPNKINAKPEKFTVLVDSDMETACKASPFVEP